MKSTLGKRKAWRWAGLATLTWIKLTGVPLGAAQQPEAPYPISRISEPIRLDGVLDEPAWTAIPPVPLVKHWPSFGGEPTERTEIRLAYDDMYLYVSCRCFDRAGAMQGPTFKRDTWTMAMDQVALVLDTFNDNESALAFVVTPTGSRIDMAVSNDAQGANPRNLSWDTFWDAAVTRTDTAWYSEARIPFSSLRFQDENGRVEMGIIAYRYLAGKVELDIFPAVEPKWGFYSFVKPSQAQTVRFDGLQSRNPLRVTPYVLSGLNREFRLSPDKTSYARIDDPARDVGLDVKYGLTNNLTLDLTLNTDFAQVEADDQQVNLTRFSLFFPEKRRFFQERASVFEYDLGGQDRLFYSRRIGLHEGKEVPLRGGARLVGRVGGWDIGLLNMQTAGQEHLATENLGVARIRRQVLNPYSYVGGIATTRIDDHGGYNLVYGLDGVLRLFGDDYLTLNWAQSFEDSLPGALATLSNARTRALWERRRFDGFGYQFSFAHSGETFNPGLGIQLREDYTRLGDRLFHGWIFPGKSAVRQLQLGLEGSAFFRNADGSMESSDVGPTLDVTTKAGSIFTGRLRHSYEDIRRPFAIAKDARVPEGQYRFSGVEIRYETPRARLLRAKTGLNAGSFYDGRLVSLDVAPIWSVSKFLELSGYYQFSRIEFAEREERFNAHIARARVETTLNTRFALTTFVQYNSAADAVIANLRLRYAARDGNDFYLVLNEGLNTDRFRIDPFLPRSSARTIIAKYSHTFQF